MAEIPVSFAVSGGELVATVTATGDGGIENGLLVESMTFTSTGSVDVDLGAAGQSVSSFKFYLGDDIADFIVAIGSDQTLIFFDATGRTTATGPTPDESALTLFWSGATQPNVRAALSGALETWIEENAVGVPVLILTGLVSGGSMFLLASASQAVDLFALFISQLANQEVTSGTLTQDQANQIIHWAKVGDAMVQIPVILEDENSISRVMSGIAADVNFESNSDSVKLGVTIASSTAGKYVLALQALKI